MARLTISRMSSLGPQEAAKKNINVYQQVHFDLSFLGHSLDQETFKMSRSLTQYRSNTSMRHVTHDMWHTCHMSRVTCILQASWAPHHSRQEHTYNVQLKVLTLIKITPKTRALLWVDCFQGFLVLASPFEFQVFLVKLEGEDGVVVRTGDVVRGEETRAKELKRRDNSCREKMLRVQPKRSLHCVPDNLTKLEIQKFTWMVGTVEVCSVDVLLCGDVDV